MELAAVVGARHPIGRIKTAHSATGEVQMSHRFTPVGRESVRHLPVERPFTLEVITGRLSLRNENNLISSICIILLVKRTLTGTDASKAPEGWRTPKPGGVSKAISVALASWTAVALYRFSAEFTG